MVNAVADSPSDPARDNPSPLARRFQCHVVRHQTVESDVRDVINEQAMRIMINGESVATLMRTPGARPTWLQASY